MFSEVDIVPIIGLQKMRKDALAVYCSLDEEVCFESFFRVDKLLAQRLCSGREFHADSPDSGR
jgi:hypothetical protein